MRARGVLLVLFGVFGAVHVVGVLFWSPLLPSAPLLAWAALLGYAALSARPLPPAVRWPLFGGLAAFGVAAFLQWQAHTTLQWQADTTEPAGQTYLVSEFARLDRVALWTAQLRAAAPLLVACGLFAGAAFVAHARTHPRRWTVAGRSIAVVGLALAAGIVAVDVWSLLPGPLTSYDWRLPVTLLLAPAACAVTVLAAAAAATHGRGGWLAAAGLGTLALLTLDTLSTMLLALPRHYGTFGQPGLMYEGLVVAVFDGSGTDLVGAALAAAQFAAVGAVTAGLALIRYAATPVRG